jgi:hypothetical protein
VKAVRSLTLDARVVVAISAIVVAIPELWSPGLQVISRVELRRNLRSWTAAQRINWNVTAGVGQVDHLKAKRMVKI